MAWWDVDATIVLCVVDGLGHGHQAEAAAQASLAFVEEHLGQPLKELFARCDRAVSSTRGVAMGIARIDTRTHALEYGAVGNTRAMLVRGYTRRFLISSPGIVGGGYRRLQLETAKLARGERLFLYTDGFPRSLDHVDFRSRLAREVPQLLADSLLATLGTSGDDNGVLIYQHDRP